MSKKKDKRKLIILSGIVIVGILLFSGIFLNVLPGLYTIYSAGDEVVSGDTVDSIDGLRLEMDYYIDNTMDVDCHLWDIEESVSVEVGIFSQDEYYTSIWAFTLDNVRNDTNPYKLVLSGDETGESFTFYINGGEGEDEEIPDPFVDPIISNIYTSATSFDAGEDVTIKFTVETYVNYEWDLKVDGVIIDSGIIPAGLDYRIDIHEYVGTQLEGGTYTYSLHLSYVDEGEELASVSDSVDITWIGSVTDTTTTETTTTTTTDDEVEPETNLFMYAGIGVVAFVILYKLTNKKKR